MYAFPDISRGEARRVGRCSRVFRYIHRQVKGEGRPAPGPGENPSELVPDAQQAKFFALGAQLVIIQGLCQQDLRFKTFYDLTGSSGRAGLAAVVLQQWSSVISIESCVGNSFDTAVKVTRLVRRVQPPIALTNPSAWRVERSNFKKEDWIDGDVVFFDGTVFENFDEGVLCRYFQGRLRALQAGSFVVLFTRCGDQLLTGDGLVLIHSHTQEHTTADGPGRRRFTSWLFKTSMQSNDRRVGVPDVHVAVPTERDNAECDSNRSDSSASSPVRAAARIFLSATETENTV